MWPFGSTSRLYKPGAVDDAVDGFATFSMPPGEGGDVVALVNSKKCVGPAWLKRPAANRMLPFGSSDAGASAVVQISGIAVVPQMAGTSGPISQELVDGV